MKLDIAAEVEDSVAACQRASYLSMACVARSRPCLETTPEGTRDSFRGETDAYLAELMARFEPMAADSDRAGSEWMLEEPAPLRIARDAERAELRCIVHRTEHDFIVIMIGVYGEEFDGAGSPAREHGLEGRMRKIRSGYEFAFSYGERLQADSPTLTEALRQLDTGLEKYVRVLAELRGEYIHPLRVLSRGEVMHLARSVDDVKRREEIRQKQDEFLDAYLDWKATHRIAERTRLLELARQLQELDPSFQFSSLE